MFGPLIQRVIQDFKCLPGVGSKSATRMILHLLKNPEAGKRLASSLAEVLEKVRRCQSCQNFSETELCPICSNPKRNQQQICVLETPLDVNAFEQSGSYQGLYFVLMNPISPIDGIGPEEIRIPQLLETIQKKQIKEVILATNATVEGDATAQYIANLLSGLAVDCSRIAYGIPLDGELGYLDSGTIARAFSARSRLSGDLS